MIELTTGIVFLVTSLYGGTSATTTYIASTTEATPVVIKTDMTVSKNIEKLVRTTYADEPILIEIARCESTFRQFDATGSILRGKVNSKDVGIMQINEKYHAEDATKLGFNIYTPEGNLAFGRYLYNKYGSSPWISSSPCWADSRTIAMVK
jgi:hypothetical protein